MDGVSENEGGSISNDSGEGSINLRVELYPVCDLLFSFFEGYTVRVWIIRTVFNLKSNSHVFFAVSESDERISRTS